MTARPQITNDAGARKRRQSTLMKSRFVAPCCASICLGASSAAADIGHVPTFTLSTDWGGRLRPGSSLTGSSLPEFDGTGGLTFVANSIHTNYIVNGKLQALFVGGSYTGEVGIVYGGAMTSTYADLISHHCVAKDAVTDTCQTTVKVYPNKKIAGVWGLSAASGITYYDGTLMWKAYVGVEVEAFTNAFFQLAFDPIRGTPGFRIGLKRRIGVERPYTFRLETELMFDKEYPTMLLFTAGLGAGSSWGYRPDYL